MTGTLLALGGLGLFLLGMAIMTDGLKTLADEKLRELLAQSTRSPFTGAVTGAISTAILQSSSATTVAAVGFVGAGLLTFPEALGIVFGANVGTTITGWLVALLGFKLNLGQAVLPLILVGVLLRMFGRSRWRAVGFALAGFGLIFVGIAAMQDGLQKFHGVLTPQSLPAATLLGRLALVLIGIIFTIITQSSSAGVAVTLAALHTETIALDQAVALVIGMDVGTTSTAVIATIGGNVQARRTGLAHVLYNLLTASIALVIMDGYLFALGRWGGAFLVNNPELALVGFHTLFNILGVSLILPFSASFAKLIIRITPERGNPLTKRLEPSLLGTPGLATKAVRATLCEIVQLVFAELVRALRNPKQITAVAEELREVQPALEETRRYIQGIRIPPGQRPAYGPHVSSLHVLDHLHRLVQRASKTARMQPIQTDDELGKMAEYLAETTAFAGQSVDRPAAETNEEIRQRYKNLKHSVKDYRRRSIETAATGDLKPQEAITRTDAARWLQRVGYHVRRIVLHLAESTPATTT